MQPSVDTKDESPPLSSEQLNIEQRILRPSLFQYQPSSDRVADESSPAGVKTEDGGEDIDDSPELWDAVGEVIDLTEDEPVAVGAPRPPSRKTAKFVPRRNEPIDSRLLPPDRDSIVKRGDFVELEAALPDAWQTSFLLVQEVYRRNDDDDDGLVLRGLPFTRTRCLRGKLPRYRNEVCLILQVDADDDRPDHVQAAIEVPLRHAMGTRQFHFTNARFPYHRFDGTYETVVDIERYAPLTCRWKYRLVYKNAEARMKAAKAVPSEFILAHISSLDDQVKAKFKVKDSVLMNQWRGGKVEGGSYDKAAGVDLAVQDNLTLDDDIPGTGGHASSPAVKPVGQRYTFGDMFSGAGGASYGARCAGFHIRTACDHWKDALETYRHNFPETELHGKDIFELIADVPDNENTSSSSSELHVDVLHLSPPCQFWSPAHTVEGKNDEANIGALMACHRLLQKFKPRLFTLEQTFGILDPRFEYYFNALLLGFTQHGYSVRWRILRLENWGLPSPRKRLVMLGACPGEALPDYPAPTHSQTPLPGATTKPYRTVYESLRGLPPPNQSDADNPLVPAADPLHHFQRRRDDPPWDPDRLLLRAITCNGGYGNHHWSGERDFTRREYATLNGFPRRYAFRGRHYQRQIGNAFPARFTRALYRHLRRGLERADAGAVVANPGDPQEVAFGDGDEISEEDEEGEGGNGRRGRLGRVEEDDEVVFKGRQFRKRQAVLPAVEWKDDDDDDNDVMEIDATGDGDVIIVADRPGLMCVDANQRGPPLMEFWNFPASTRENPIDLDDDNGFL